MRAMSKREVKISTVEVAIRGLRNADSKKHKRTGQEEISRLS